MKEKNIFIAILILILVAIGVIAYRVAYKGNERPIQVVPTTPQAPGGPSANAAVPTPVSSGY